jgi:hypothetical protein
MKIDLVYMIGILIVGVVLGIIWRRSMFEGFNDASCDSRGPLGDGNVCPPCRQPDMSRYVLKSTVPPCPSPPDLSQYILKTEVPPVPDLSNYVLKSSIPAPQPVILDCTKCNKPSGECPPCPRPRCPEVKCPAPTVCPPALPCPRQTCPPAVVKCQAEAPPNDAVRPFLAPLSYSMFGKSM